jgi:hypothetical protein
VMWLWACGCGCAAATGKNIVIPIWGSDVIAGDRDWCYASNITRFAEKTRWKVPLADLLREKNTVLLLKKYGWKDKWIELQNISFTVTITREHVVLHWCCWKFPNISVTPFLPNNIKYISLFKT